MLKNENRTVLLTRFSALGDVALCIPEVYDACEQHPDTHFVMLTRKHPAGLFINHPENLTVIGIDTSNYKGAAGLWRLWRELQGKYHFSAMVDLHDVLRSKLLRAYARLSGVKVTVFDKGRKEKRALTRRNNKVLLPLKQTSRRYAEALATAGYGGNGSFDSLYGEKPKSGDKYRFQLQAAAGHSGSKEIEKGEGDYWLAIAPFARHAGKIYPLDQMERVVEEYAGRPGYRIFIFGYGEGESSVIQGWIDRISERYRERTGEAMAQDKIINMAYGKGYGFEKELELLSNCDTMVSMDSANLHLASLVGLRTVSIWGATHPYTGFGGYGQDPTDAVQLDLTCRPCSVFGNKKCLRKDYHCLKGITPKLIIDRIDSKTPFHKQ